jgi:hypothetical protein
MSFLYLLTNHISSLFFADDCPHGWVSHNIDDNLYCYTLRKHYHSWLKAYVKCRQFGAELLTITSPSEQEFIRYRVQKENYVWIGLSDFRKEGNWTWENKYVLLFITKYLRYDARSDWSNGYNMSVYIRGQRYSARLHISSLTCRERIICANLMAPKRRHLVRL